MVDYYDRSIYLLVKNKTFELVPYPQGKNIMECKLMYQTNFTLDGVGDIHISYLVENGFFQWEGFNYI
jgi:hypothetical protein